MKIEIRGDNMAEISGYVNATERKAARSSRRTEKLWKKSNRERLRERLNAPEM